MASSSEPPASPSELRPTRGSRGEHGLALLASLVLSVVSIGVAGRLGFHFEDLSIPFDGGYRVALGQRPFVDFVAPIGPVLFLQQGLFFTLFGVSHTVFLLHAMVLGTVATWLVWWRTRPWGRRPALAAGLGTLAWFYLPPAAPYIDTNAFFWTLIALVALWPGLFEPEPMRRLGPVVLAGLAAGLAFLSKQNIGGLAVAGLGLLLLLTQRRLKPLVVFVLGAATPLVLLVAWAWSQGTTDLLATYFWQVPLESGRLKYLVPWSARMGIKLVRPELVDSTLGFMAGKAIRELMVYALCAVLGWRAWRSPPEHRGPWLTAAFLLVLQQWSYNTSNNDEVLYWPFAGLLLALLWRLFRTQLGKLGGRSGLAAATAVLVAGGLVVGLGRQVHSLQPHNLGPALDHPRLAGLALYPREGRELSTLLATLERDVPADDRLFILGHSTLLYAAADRPPPQPLLWFRAGVSYSADDPSSTDALILRSLEAAEVRWIVLDPVGSDELLADFPQLATWVDARFRPTEHALGDYRLLQRIP